MHCSTEQANILMIRHFPERTGEPNVQRSNWIAHHLGKGYWVCKDPKEMDLALVLIH